MARLLQLAIVLDQTLNVLVGSGWADETLSAYFWRAQKTTAIRRTDRLFRFLRGEHGHCRQAFESERARRHLPPEYRRAARV